MKHRLPIVTFVALVPLVVHAQEQDCLRILSGASGVAEMKWFKLDDSVFGLELIADDLETPGSAQKEVVATTEGLLPSLLCASANRVAFIGQSGGEFGWVANSFPDLIHVDSTNNGLSEARLHDQTLSRQFRAQLAHTLVHEATHTAQNLLNAVGSNPDKPLDELDHKWSAQTIERARKIVASNLLEQGFVREWARLHQRAIDVGYAQPYHGQGASHVLTEQQIRKMAVVNVYGGHKASDDMAELVAGMSPAPGRFGSPVPPGVSACDLFQEQPGPGIPGEIAVLFAKVGFLHSTGLIDDADYEFCVGNLKVRATGNGFFTLRDGAETNSYTGDVGGSIGTSSADGSWVFQMQAEGEVGVTGQGMKPARIELTIPLAAAGAPRPSFPRGLYAIGRGIAGKGGGATVNIYYRDSGEEKLGVTMESGLVLVSRASTKLVEGSIFVFRFVNWTSLLPWPEGAGDMVITFRKQN